MLALLEMIIWIQENMSNEHVVIQSESTTYITPQLH